MDGDALILCEGYFARIDGKTAHGLVRHTDRYNVVGVIDSTLAGRDAGEVLNGEPNGIPIYRSLDEALGSVADRPSYLVIGLATEGGILPDYLRPIIRSALEQGLNVDSGLHQFLGDDSELSGVAQRSGAVIRDVRRPPPRDELHFFSGNINSVKAKRIATLGTDCALGKRTTATILAAGLNAAGYKTEMIGTGQTAWFQGARYGIMLDSLINDFVGGELERVIVDADRNESPEYLLIEGQACLTHPGGSGGFEILSSAKPQGVILQHAPNRKTYDGYPDFPLAPPEAHIETIENLFGTKVIALGINPEGYDRDAIPDLIAEHEDRYGILCCDPVGEGPQKLIEAVLAL